MFDKGYAQKKNTNVKLIENNQSRGQISRRRQQNNLGQWQLKECQLCDDVITKNTWCDIAPIRVSIVIGRKSSCGKLVNLVWIFKMQVSAV